MKMKEKLLKLLKNILITSVLLNSNLAKAADFTVNSANNYPYKNLVERTDAVKVFYTNNGGEQRCRVEVILKSMKWVSAEKKIDEGVFNKNKLSNCLPIKKAEQILLQTFLQFGRGL